jgi:DNA-binding CsgD family transcriptional regulator
MSDIASAEKRLKSVALSLLEQSQQFIAANIKNGAEEAIIKSVKLAEMMFPDRVVLLCHLIHHATPYVSKSCKNILGFTAYEIRQFSPQDYFARVHPNDLKAMEDGFKIIKQACSGKEMHRLRFVFNYRFKHKKGDYIHLRDEKLTLLTEDNQYVFFILLNEVKEPFHFTKLEELVLDESGLKKIDHHIFKHSADAKLTQREMEMIRLIDTGFTNNQISEHLNISVSTVKKHRHSAFKKMNVKNSHSLVKHIRELY